MKGSVWGWNEASVLSCENRICKVDAMYVWLRGELKSSACNDFMQMENWDGS